jgi:hypothetical protein
MVAQLLRTGVQQDITRRGCKVMARIKQNKPAISADARSFRAIRRLNINRTYMSLKVGAVAGYILLGMLSASTSMFGILVGAMLRMVGL